MNNSMKTRLLLLAMLLSAGGAAAQNTIAIGENEMEYLSLGQSVSLPVTMNNVDDIVAVELTVKLPNGGRLNTDGCQLTAARANSHQLSAACIDRDNNI